MRPRGEKVLWTLLILVTSACAFVVARLLEPYSFLDCWAGDGFVVTPCFDARVHTLAKSLACAELGPMALILTSVSLGRRWLALVALVVGLLAGLAPFADTLAALMNAVLHGVFI